jgi:hypothetical protein
MPPERWKERPEGSETETNPLAAVQFSIKRTHFYISLSSTVRCRLEDQLLHGTVAKRLRLRQFPPPFQHPLALVLLFLAVSYDSQRSIWVAREIHLKRGKIQKVKDQWE